MLAKKIAMDSIEESVKVKYGLDLSHLTSLSKFDLELWLKREIGFGPTSLDTLYAIK